jgi:hypothetical protein
MGDLLGARGEVLEHVNGGLKLLVYWNMEMVPKPDEMQEQSQIRALASTG